MQGLTTTRSSVSNRRRLLAALLLLLLLAGCRTAVEEEPATPAPTIAGEPVDTVAVSLFDLVRNRASFKDQFIRLNGRYAPLPILVCAGQAHRSPATWLLQDEGVEVAIAGYESTLRRLNLADQEMTVEGRWQRWQGPVGCDRRAPTQEIWYLEVSRILAPNPLVRAIPDDEIAGVPDEPPVETATPVPAETADPGSLPSPTVTVTVPPGDDPFPTVTTAPGSTQTPTATTAALPTPPPLPSATLAPTATAGAGATATPTATTTPGVTGTATTTGTPTNTPDPGQSATPTATAGAATNTPTATATATTAASTIEQGSIDPDNMAKRDLAASTTHRWTVSAAAGDVISVTVGASLNLDVELTLVDPDGNNVASVNDGGQGQGEKILKVTTVSGTYAILVKSSGGTTGAYGLYLVDKYSAPWLIVRQTLNYGGTGSGTTRARTDHLWHFQAAAGDSITIQVTAADAGDAYVALVYENYLSPIKYERGSDVTLTYTIDQAGFYTIDIGEYNYDSITYTLSLTKQ